MFTLENEEETLLLGKKLATLCTPPLVIFLHGDLGAGKTTFVRGFLQGLNFTGKVKSPTYTLVEPYHINDWFINHFDLYRLQNPEELDLIGWREYFTIDSICLIEWPERGHTLLPSPDLTCYIRPLAAGRSCEVIAHNKKAETVFRQL